MIDWIKSHQTAEVFAKVDIQPDPGIQYLYSGLIVSSDFPRDLQDLIVEYDELVRSCSLTLLDQVEERIYAHQMRLAVLDRLIFCLTIHGKAITFLTKYPSAAGFVDTHPF